MSRVRALVEGRTELIFVQEVLAPELARSGVYVTASMFGKPGQHKHGGIKKWSAASRDIEHALKGDPTCTITTMVDYYGLPDDWRATVDRPDAHARVEAIEARMTQELGTLLGKSFDARRFIPYVQLHEFEALLFTRPGEIARTLEVPQLESVFQRIVDACGGPELIDDDTTTAPSKRIVAVAPRYNKVRHGILAAGRIGLAAMRAACPRFDMWVARLGNLADPL